MRSRKLFRKLHRWIGIFASLWLLLLASTGLLLQHSQDWQLDKTYITNLTLLKSYGIGNQFIAFEQGKHQLTQLDKQLIQDGKVSLKLTESIKAALYNQSNWIMVTDTKIQWINNQAEIIQSMDELDGITFPIDNIGLFNHQIYIANNKKITQLTTLQHSSIQYDTVNWSLAITKSDLKQQAITQTSHNYLSLEQLVFDLHAGITAPSLLNDIAAISLIVLSISGIFLFFKKRKTNRQAT